jgi:hypothetical protein
MQGGRSNMRAKNALALTALSAIALLATIPTVSASSLTRDVANILNREGLYRRPIYRSRIITQPAVIAGGATPLVAGNCAAPAAAVVTDACGAPVALAPAPLAVRTKILTDGNGTPLILSQPVVIAPAAGGVAILTPGPSDLDARRDALEKRIIEATALNQLDAAESCDLKAALQQVKQAEVTWLAAGPLNNQMTRRLYRSMDKIDSDLHYYASPNSVNLLGLRLNSWS